VEEIQRCQREHEKDVIRLTLLKTNKIGKIYYQNKPRLKEQVLIKILIMLITHQVNGEYQIPRQAVLAFFRMSDPELPLEAIEETIVENLENGFLYLNNIWVCCTINIKTINHKLKEHCYDWRVGFFHYIRGCLKLGLEISYFNTCTGQRNKDAELVRILDAEVEEGVKKGLVSKGVKRVSYEELCSELMANQDESLL
jgi:hypothetical protein